ncbi:MAG: hypothetical protein NTX52_10795, partial [Planctomycetota bacterium]|nr:hypothetical protein [Planctomycetota bacterium]
MTGKLIRTSFPAVVVLMLTGLSFGQNTRVFPQPSLPRQNSDTSATNVPANSVPSIVDLMTVIDKATSKETKGKDWSTPIKLVIIFTGLAILPSLLVMMTSFTR